jgi:hypothetical protein
MGTMRIVVVISTLFAISVAAAAQQTPNQSQPNQNQPNQKQAASPNNQNQTQPQNQPAQPQPKKSIWQKMRDVAQQGQNTTQQGQNTVQQMTQPGQNGTQQVQNGVQGVQQGVQGIQGVAQPGQASGAFSGGGSGAGTCGPSCFDAGAFQANVSQMMVSQEGPWHIIRMSFQFHNSTNQPLVIAYHDGSMVMVDNNGNAYIPAGGNPGELQGMGIDRGNQTDPQFVLAPGQTGNAMFAVARNRPATSPIGTSYSYNLTIDELQTQNGALAIPVRTYNLNFPTLAPGSTSAAFSSGSSPMNGVATRNGNVSGATPQTNVQRVSGQPAAVSAPQQRTRNATPASVVNNAALKTPLPAARPANVPATVKPTAAVATTKTTTPPKKTPPPTTTTTPAK